jgi:hypothetical protein
MVHDLRVSVRARLNFLVVAVSYVGAGRTTGLSWIPNKLCLTKLPVESEVGELDAHLDEGITREFELIHYERRAKILEHHGLGEKIVPQAGSKAFNFFDRQSTYAKKRRFIAMFEFRFINSDLKSSFTSILSICGNGIGLPESHKCIRSSSVRLSTPA